MTRLLLALVFLLAAPCTTFGVEILHWERLPLAARLLVGQERVILMDRDVRVGVPPSAREVLRVQSTGGALYLRADAPLPATRLQLQDTATGAIVLLDVRAEPAREGEAAPEPLRIVSSGREQLGEAATEEPSNLERPAVFTAVPVLLTRHAAQSLYAPLRTITPVPGIAPVPLKRDLPLVTLLPSFSVNAVALAAWRLGEHYLTAVKLTNSTGRVIELDPRALQGDFIAATFQHRTLGAAGESTDTTVLYLVTRGHGIAESLPPSLAPIDAARNLSGIQESGR